MVEKIEHAALGLPKDLILQMLKKGVPLKDYAGHAEFVQKHVIPNVAEVIAANNEAILFALKDPGATYDSKY
jgi:hypothetical protein